MRNKKLVHAFIGGIALAGAAFAGALCLLPTVVAGQAQTAGPIPLMPLSAGQCRTFAPRGWRITDINKAGTAFSVASADGSMGASYGALAVNGGEARGMYGPQYRTPEAFALYSISVLTHQQAQAMGPEENVGYFRALKFATASYRGYVLLYRFPVPADPAGYGLIMRIAIGNARDPRSVGIAGAVAMATRCVVQLQPPPHYANYKPPRDDHGTGKTDNNDDLGGTYNAQLGTGWVHDANGTNYNVDVNKDYCEKDCPNGPGYYMKNGNDIFKLQPGMAD